MDVPITAPPSYDDAVFESIANNVMPSRVAKN